MTEFCALRPKTDAYLMEDGSGHKKAKGTKKCVVKREIICLNTIKIIYLMIKHY